MCAQRLVCYCEAEININLGSRACRGFWWLKTEAVCHRATHQVPQSSQQRVVCCSLENSGPHLKNGSLSDIFQPEFISSISRHKAVFSFTLPAYAAFLSYFSSLFFFSFFFQTWSSVAFRPGLSVFFSPFPLLSFHLSEEIWNKGDPFSTCSGFQRVGGVPIYTVPSYWHQEDFHYIARQEQCLRIRTSHSLWRYVQTTFLKG